MSEKKNEFLTGSICLSDIPQHLITNHANGKKYVNIAIGSRREKGQYGETHNIIVSVPKDQRKEGDKPIYIGNLKEWQGQQQGGNTPPPNTSQGNDSDLPF